MNKKIYIKVEGVWEGVFGSEGLIETLRDYAETNKYPFLILDEEAKEEE